MQTTFLGSVSNSGIAGITLTTIDDAFTGNLVEVAITQSPSKLGQSLFGVIDSVGNTYIVDNVSGGTSTPLIALAHSILTADLPTGSDISATFSHPGSQTMASVAVR